VKTAPTNPADASSPQGTKPNPRKNNRNKRKPTGNTNNENKTP